MEKGYDSTVSQRGGGSASLMMGIPKGIAQKIKFAKGDKVNVWVVADDDGKLYMVVEKKSPEVPPKILSKLRGR